MVEKFERADEGNSEKKRRPSERLQAFTKALWHALVPSEGSCASVQGELIRAKERLRREYFHNGMCNYFHRDDPGETFADNYYGELLLFVLDTMIANSNQAISEDDVAYFSGVRRDVETQWLWAIRSGELEDKGDEEGLSAEEEQELARLDELPRGPDWEAFLNRADRCIANWCLSNTALIDRQGNPVVERGVVDVRAIVEPPPAQPPCALCNGKGWVAPSKAGGSPAMCSCLN